MNELRTAPIGRLLLKHSLPAILGNLAFALYSIVDAMFIGHTVGSDALAGMSLTMPLFHIVVSFGIIIASGSATMISIRMGENKQDEAEIILGNSLTLYVLISIVLSSLGLLFMEPLLKIFSASDVTLPYAKDYMRIMFGGMFFNFMAYGMNAMIRAEGRPNYALWVMLSGNIINLILDPIFIIVFKMGVSGAAWASIIATFVSALVALYYYLADKSELKLKKACLKLNFKVLKPCIAVGMSPFIMTLSANLMVALLNKQLYQYGGGLTLAVMGIINGLLGFCLFPIIGINMGLKPIIGYNYGAAEHERVKEALVKGLCISTLLCFVLFLIIQLGAEKIISAYSSNDPDLLEMGTYALRVVMSLFFIIGFHQTACVFFQACGKAKLSIFLTLLRQVILYLPLVFLLPKFWGLNGIWLITPLADLGATVVAGFFFIKEFKKLKVHQGIDSQDQLELPQSL